MSGPKYPDVSVQLTGTNSNAFALIGKVTNALKRTGHGDECGAFRAEAMSGDYDNLLRICMEWVDVS